MNSKSIKDTMGIAKGIAQLVNSTPQEVLHVFASASPEDLKLADTLEKAVGLFLKAQADRIYQAMDEVGGFKTEKVDLSYVIQIQEDPMGAMQDAMSFVAQVKAGQESPESDIALSQQAPAADAAIAKAMLH